MTSSFEIESAKVLDDLKKYLIFIHFKIINKIYEIVR